MTGYSHAVDVVAYDGSDVVWEINVYDDICDAFKHPQIEKGVAVKWGALHGLKVIFVLIKEQQKISHERIY